MPGLSAEDLERRARAGKIDPIRMIPDKHIATMCREIIRWHDTGLLQDGAFRQYVAEDPRSVELGDSAMRAAESRVVLEAARRFSSRL